ncbi:hypothetical protein BH09ACT5_BH09ACT5_08340 [soil metagenome]
MRTSQQSKLIAIVGSAIVAVSLCACSTERAPAPYSAQDTVEEFAGIDFDYDPLNSPAALAEESTLVVTGTIDRVQEGRVQIYPKNEKLPGASTIVLVLRDVTAVQGSLAERSDGFVYIELPNPGGRKPDAYQDGLRAGANVVAYLVPGFEGAPTKGVDVAVANPKAGRPQGQALYLPAGPQALALQYENEAVVWPLIGEELHGALADTLPGGKLIAR